MKLFGGNSNMSSQLVTTDLCALELRIKKATPALTLGDFLASDTIQITYNSQGRQENVCPSLPLSMLAYFATMHNGFIKAIYGSGADSAKVAEVHLRVDVGFGGSIPLSDNKQLLISTNITGLATSGDSLVCHAITTGKNVDPTGKPAPVAILCYDYINLEAGNFKNIDISQATGIVFTPATKDVTFVDRTGNSYIQSIEALQSVASAVNEIAVMFGSFVATDKFSISGTSTVQSMFKAADVEPGGVRYVGVGVAPYQAVKVKSVSTDGLLLVTPKMLE